MDLERVYREERPRALATLIRLLGDFDLAEESLQEASVVALDRWPVDGVPANPASWLISTAKHKAIDRLRRAASLAAKASEAAREALLLAEDAPEETEVFGDDRLRLIFTCCHPALAAEAQIALTLKTLCGFSVDEIARAFLVPAATMAQRLVRAKGKIRDARIPYEVPGPGAVSERVLGVLRVVYLVFTEGYAPTSGGEALREDLSAEAIRLGRLLVALLPGEPEAEGLLALMLLQDARKRARFDAGGELVTLEAQDRCLWDREQIAEGSALAERVLRSGGSGFYGIQAAIAALHGQAATAEATDWAQIVILYRLLLRRHPSPVVALNHAAAVGMAHGPARGLELIEALERRFELASYHLLPAAKADFLRRLGKNEEAAGAYREALGLVTSDVERRYLERRLQEVGSEPRQG